MEFILNRNKTVVGKGGHSIEFVKDQPTHVPPEMHSEVMAVGALPVDDLPAEDVDPKQAPTDALERQALIIDAMKKLVARNQRGDFLASGVPDAKALKEVLGFNVDSKERNDVWAVYQAEQRGEA